MRGCRGDSFTRGWKERMREREGGDIERGGKKGAVGGGGG